jgi:uncharacterized membrane protein
MDTVVLSVFRLLVGAALFFFVPGFFLTAVLFPKKQDLQSLERISVAVIISVRTLNVCAGGGVRDGSVRALAAPSAV